MAEQAKTTDKTTSALWKEHDIYGIVQESKQERRPNGLKISRGRPKRQPRRRPTKLRRGFTGR